MKPILFRPDTRTASLVNVAADQAGALDKNVQFKVVDLGKGRVALRAANGQFVSATEDKVSLKDLADGKVPGDAESFQWVNLMRGDAMLMSSPFPLDSSQQGYLSNSQKLPCK